MDVNAAGGIERVGGAKNHISLAGEKLEESQTPPYENTAESIRNLSQ